MLSNAKSVGIIYQKPIEIEEQSFLGTCSVPDTGVMRFKECSKLIDVEGSRRENTSPKVDVAFNIKEQVTR